VSLIARHLEAHGLPTLCLGSALDILEAGRPPRAVFVDYPLGHTAGRPFDRGDQRAIVRAALAAFETLGPGDPVRALANRWGEEHWRAEASATDVEDTREPRDETPRFQEAADREAARAAGLI